MLDGFGYAPEMNRGRSAKERLVREADEAFVAGDRARCSYAIERLYSFFDSEQQRCDSHR